MSKIKLNKTEVNHYDETNGFYNVRIVGTGLNNNKRASVSIDNSIDFTVNRRGFTFFMFSENFTFLSSQTFDTYASVQARQAVGAVINQQAKGYFVLVSYDAWDTDKHLDNIMRDYGASLFFLPARRYDTYTNEVLGLNRTDLTTNNEGGKHYRRPYAAFGKFGYGIISEDLGSSLGGKSNPDATIDITVPHIAQVEKLSTGGGKRHFVRMSRIYNTNETFANKINKPYNDYLYFILNYRTADTPRIRIRLIDETNTTVFNNTYTFDSNIFNIETIIIPRLGAVRYIIDFLINTGQSLIVNYVTLCNAGFNPFSKLNESESSFRISKYGNINTNETVENFVGFDPFIKGSYDSSYNNSTNMLKTSFDPVTNGGGFLYSTKTQTPCLFLNNSSYETPFIELPSTDVFYYFSFFATVYKNCVVKLKTYDVNFNQLNTTRISDNNINNSHIIINDNSVNTDEHRTGLLETFLIPEASESDNKGFFNDISNKRYGLYNKSGIHLDTTKNETIKYSKETRFVKIVFEGNVKIFKPILTYLTHSVKKNGLAFLGNIEEGINIINTFRRVIKMAEDVDLGINSTVGGYQIITTANIATLGAQILADVIIPAGTVMAYAGASIPSGWMVADGRSLPSATYQRLYAAIGTRYGGNATNFRVPDLRGEFVRGFDAGRGVDSGRTLGSHQGDAIRNITGTIGTIGESGTINGAFARAGLSGSIRNSGDRDWDATFDASRVVPTAEENRPRNVSMYYIIKV